MLHTIKNEFLTVAAHETGAQLWSITDAQGAQYLWQGDAAYWGDRALTIFPYVARLWQGRYEMDGQLYEMPIHGFAPQSRFTVTENTGTRMVFALGDSEATRAIYPRRFAFEVIYALEGDTLRVSYAVHNRDARPMYFGMGGHPGFNVPLDAGKAFSDYRLRFAAPCAPVRVGFTADCFVTGANAPYPLEGGCVLPLRHDLFDDDAIVLRGMTREVTLEAAGGGRCVTVSFPDMPVLGIWHCPGKDAPYVCIEPWTSLPARHGEIACFERQEDLIRLDPGKSHQSAYAIRVHRD